MAQTYDSEFSGDFQDLLLACIVRRPDSFLGYEGVLNYAFFSSAHSQNVAQVVIEAMQAGSVPSFTAIGQILFAKSGGAGSDRASELTEYIQKLSEIEVRDADVEVAVKQAVNFARVRAATAVAIDMVGRINKNQPVGSDIVDKLQAAISIGANLNDQGIWFHADYEKVKSKVLGEDYNIFTGYDLLDKIWRRGWGPGWLIVPLAPPKRFKSAFSANLALSMIGPRYGYDVIYYALEISAELVAMRGYYNVSQKTQDEFYDTPESFEEALKEGIQMKAAGRLLIKSFPAGTASIADIRAHAKSVINASSGWTIEKDGQTPFRPKLIIIDYAETVKAKGKGGDHDDPYMASTDVYTDARSLGSELRCAVVMPERCNRASITAVVPSMDSFQGRVQKAGIVDVMFGLCGSDEEIQAGIWRLFVVLNRHSPAHQHLRGKLDLAHMTMTLDEELEWNETMVMKAEHDKQFGRGGKARAAVDKRLEE